MERRAGKVGDHPSSESADRAFLENLRNAETDDQVLGATAKALDFRADQSPTMDELLQCWEYLKNRGRKETEELLKELGCLSGPPDSACIERANASRRLHDSRACDAFLNRVPSSTHARSGARDAAATQTIVASFVWGTINPTESASTFVQLAHLWVDVHKLPSCPKFPLAPLVSAWRERPRHPSRVHVVLMREREPPEGREPIEATRLPAALSIATLAVVEVEGTPFATGQPGIATQSYKISAPLQGDLFRSYPRTLAGHATGGALVWSVADLALGGDERRPLRADLLRLGTFAFALTHAIRLTESQGAVLIGNRDTQANRRRFNRAMGALRCLAIEVKPGTWWDLADAERGPVNRIGPARWWLDETSDGPRAWRLSGTLLVPASLPNHLIQTVAGLEGALLWGPNPGKGRHGRIPSSVQASRKGGHGPSLFIPWWQVLRLAGDHVGPDGGKTAQRRYARRCDDLMEAGYVLKKPSSREAERGGTIEVVERWRGGRGRTAGLIVRASARWCEAYANPKRGSLPAAQLLSPR